MRRNAALSSTQGSLAAPTCQRQQPRPRPQRMATAKEEKTGLRPQLRWPRELTPRREKGESGGQGEATLEAVEAMADMDFGREVEEAIEAGHTSSSNCCQPTRALVLFFK